MDALTHGGTPPTLWPKVRAPRNTANYQSRIASLARQIEKLSWMLELMDQEPGIALEGAEYHWQHAHASLR